MNIFWFGSHKSVQFPVKSFETFPWAYQKQFTMDEVSDTQNEAITKISNDVVTTIEILFIENGRLRRNGH